MNRTVVSTPQAPQAIGPYSQAIRTDSLIFVSGQVPIDPATGELVIGDIVMQTRRVLENIQVILEAAGSGLSRVVKTTVFLTDLSDFAAMNTVYAGFFPVDPPARSTIQVAALPKGARIEIEVVALPRADAAISATEP